MSTFTVELTDDPRAALARAGDLLRRRPVEHNIPLSLLEHRVSVPVPGRYWTVLDGDEPAGFAFQSPLTFSAALSCMAAPAAAALADAMAQRGITDLPGVIAEAATAAAFAGAWSERAPILAVPVEGQRIYRLSELRPVLGVPGFLRPATPADVELLTAWRVAFNTSTGNQPPGDPAEVVARDIAEGVLSVWDDGGAVSGGRATRPTSTVGDVCRIGIVYTPPERRRHGYAAACVAALCAQARDHGGATCMLYTQLANPTSNGVYRRLGFEAVAEVLCYRFSRA